MVNIYFILNIISDHLLLMIWLPICRTVVCQIE
uniref:Uncharacterized protein n=1 Tax=Anguilla anguilla TaxID=7936 RepID=A0A0E9XT73_ANGAN